MKEDFKEPYKFGLPPKVGLYDPQFEKDSCGVGLVANIKGIPSREIMDDAFLVNSKMDHRGGCGFEENTGDGAGILMAIPDGFFRIEAKKLNLDFSLPTCTIIFAYIFGTNFRSTASGCSDWLPKVSAK